MMGRPSMKDDMYLGKLGGIETNLELIANSLKDIVENLSKEPDLTVQVKEPNETVRTYLKLIDYPIALFDLSHRVSQVLVANEFYTVKDLISKSEKQLLKFRNFGIISLTEIKELLDMMDLRLGMAPAEIENLADVCMDHDPQGRLTVKRDSDVAGDGHDRDA